MISMVRCAEITLAISAPKVGTVLLKQSSSSVFFINLPKFLAHSLRCLCAAAVSDDFDSSL